MNKKIYVGNLPFQTTSESLQQFFAQVGTVASAKVIMDQESGRSKGFGFVEMSTDEEAQKAIEKLNGQDLGGRSVRVSEARQDNNRPRGGGGGGRGGYGGGGGGRGGFGGGGRGGYDRD